MHARGMMFAQLHHLLLGLAPRTGQFEAAAQTEQRE